MSSLVLTPKSPSTLHLDPVFDVALESAQALTCFHGLAGGPQLMAQGFGLMKEQERTGTVV